MATAIITLEDNGTDDVRVKFSFSPALDDSHASHRLAALAMTAISSEDQPLEVDEDDDEETPT